LSAAITDELEIKPANRDNFNAAFILKLSCASLKDTFVSHKK